MKLKASVLKSIPLELNSGVYAQKLAARIAPGQSFEMADGSRLRVHQVASSPDGLYFKVAGRKEPLTIKQFAALGPVSPAMRRLASFVRFALDNYIDDYVKEAIKAAGLPVDEKMNWAKYLNKMYRTSFLQITPDETLWNDAVSDLLLLELYKNKDLETKFNPDHPALAGKPLDQKVTAYLLQLFQGRRELVTSYLRRIKGAGTGVALDKETGVASGLESGKDSEGNKLNMVDVQPESKEKSTRDVADYEGMEEINEFLREFKGYIDDTQGEASAKLINMITDYFLDGMDRKEIRETMLNDDTLVTKSGKHLDIPAYNFIMQTWAKQLKKFAQDTYPDLPVSKLISRIEEKEKAKAKKPAVASLVTAAATATTSAPSSTSSTTTTSDLTVGTTPTQTNNVINSQIPTNPNVIQQQNALAPAPMSNAADQGLETVGEANKTRGTVAPEIPGANHGADTKPVPPQQQQPGMNPPRTASLYWPPRKQARDHFDSSGFWAGEGGGASGILPICSKTSRICLAWRNRNVHMGDCWGTIGGAIQRGMSPGESAKEEMGEETGYHGPIQLHPAYVFSKGTFKYYNFIGVVNEEFGLNPTEHGYVPDEGSDDDNAMAPETDFIKWMTLDEIREEMKTNSGEFHPGLISLFKQSASLIEDLTKSEPARTIEEVEVEEEEEEEPMPADKKKPINPQKTPKKNTYAKLRFVAAKEPGELGLAFTELSSRLAAVATSMNTMTANLDLTMLPPADGAKIAERVAFRNKFAKKLKATVEENPDEIATKMSEFNTELEEIVSQFHTLADNLGVKLEEPNGPEIAEESFKEPNPATPEVTDKVKPV